MASKQQNISINTFISQNSKSLFFIVIFLTLLFAGGKMFGASPFTEDFDSYIAGDLNNQSDWEDCQSYWSYQVSTTTSYSEPSSAFTPQSVWGRCSEKTGNQIETGSWSFWGRIFAGAGSISQFYLYSGTSTQAEAMMSFDTGGNIDYYNGSSWINVCSVDDDVWFWSIIEWDNTTNKVRYTCESISQTSGWVDPPYDQTINYLSRFRLLSTGNNPNTYIDDIGEMSSCQFHETYSSCIDDNCSWYYSIYLQEYFCVDLITPDDEECDAFYKCQYCSDQTTCEEQLNCQWTDRGYGDQCYMIEPTIPPDQVSWEIPDLDDCSSLPALDTLVCEIKNLITGAVMPSQAKIETLYQTIGAFKNKFPFNYVASLDDFFTNISDDLEATSTIPIEILGATSSVNFVFWNATTTIGGSEETLKNILIDLTTFIILLGWFTWFISLIKRFF